MHIPGNEQLCFRYGGRQGGGPRPATSRENRRATQRRLRREAKKQHKLQFRSEVA